MRENSGRRPPLLTEIQAQAGSGKYLVLARLTVTTDGAILQVLGGEKPHVGAVALAVPHQSLADPGRISASTAVIPRVAHKDDQVAKPLAEWLAVSLEMPVAVIAGLHISGANQEDIERLVAHAWEAARGARAQYTRLVQQEEQRLPCFDG